MNAYVYANDSRLRLGGHVASTLDGNAQHWLGLFHFDSPTAIWLGHGTMAL